ncbi:MAG: hypothetical protein WC769_00005 [Thermodesulfovibrionales bacterium]|jgi:hypothetical protein
MVEKNTNPAIRKRKLKTWDSLFKSLDKFSGDFMNERIQPEEQIRNTTVDMQKKP